MATTRKKRPTRRRVARPSLPATMRAAAIDRTGPASVLKIHELPLPKMGARDVMIAVDTAGVGSWEPSQRSGEWAPAGAHFPLVLGSDGSGTVVARGARARRLRVGDKVYAFNFGGKKGGFDAEYVAVPEPTAARIPRPLDLLHAGATAAVALTAIQGIDDALHVKRKVRDSVCQASRGSRGRDRFRARRHRVRPATGRRRRDRWQARRHREGVARLRSRSRRNRCGARAAGRRSPHGLHRCSTSRRTSCVSERTRAGAAPTTRHSHGSIGPSGRSR
jgi:hypothetical protein